MKGDQYRKIKTLRILAIVKCLSLFLWDVYERKRKHFFHVPSIELQTETTQQKKLQALKQKAYCVKTRFYFCSCNSILKHQ